MCKFKDADQESYKWLEGVFLDLTNRALLENEAQILAETYKQLEFSWSSDTVNTHCAQFAYWLFPLELEEVQLIKSVGKS